MSAVAERRLLTGFDQEMIEGKARRAGIAPDKLCIRSISRTADVPTEHDFQRSICELNELAPAAIVGLDETALRFTTGLKSVTKWHLSPLDALDGFITRKIIPSFHPDQIKKEWHLGLYLEMALRRAQQNSTTGYFIRKPTRYLLDPSHDEAIAFLESAISADWASIDIETGRSQINTFGVATSGSDALAIKLLPDAMPAAAHYKIWSLIARLCESDVPKVMQNGIFERMWLSRYGIRINNFAWDTMCAMKFLYPELEKGLDNVGRIYTNEPYWKGGGRVSSEEGKQKDWNNIRDWPMHLTYNCKDTSNTLIARGNQESDLRARGLLDLYNGYIRELFNHSYEMCARGLPLNVDTQARLIAEYEAKSASLVKGLSKEINPRSFKQKIALLHSKGLRIPQKRDKKKGGSRDSSDELTLKKMRLSYPDDTDLKSLLEIASVEKALSSYFRVRTFPDLRIRYMVDGCSTETWRMSCSKDPWDRGFNGQTMPPYVKQMIEWKPEDDRVFFEIDLRQAETRYVAYEACDEVLMGMLARDEDIHRYVAAEIYTKPMAAISHDERQLGKKAGHGASYGEGINSFMDNCLKEMDLVLTRPRATHIMGTYHRLFTGIKRRQDNIRRTIYNERKLTNPLGMVRYFYGRTDESTYREAFAHNPQSTIPAITNHLMLKMLGARTEGALKWQLHIQTHDSYLGSCHPTEIPKIAAFSVDYEKWHPTIILPAGKLVIPTELKWGRNLGAMEKFKHG